MTTGGGGGGGTAGTTTTGGGGGSPTSPVAVPTVTGAGATFRNTGCFNDPPVGNPLDGPSFVSSGMSLEGCADFCAPYQFFAVESGEFFVR